MSAIEDLTKNLSRKPVRWLVTGAAGFIGSNLVERLLKLNQVVVGLDNFFSGKKENLEEIKNNVGSSIKNFSFIEGDIVDLDCCRKAVSGVEIVLHQAAIGSVPRSIEDPSLTHRANCDGFFNMILASKDSGVSRFVYASSSSVYGDDLSPRKIEEKTGTPLSPYAASKTINEIYAATFSQAYGIETVGLRYFNVFGPRQDPNGMYAAVIPKWIALLRAGKECSIYGDGTTSRDFCYVENIIQVNLLAALTSNKNALNQVYNVGCGETTSLSQLFDLLVRKIEKRHPVPFKTARYEPFRKGDISFSLAGIEKISRLLGYIPSHDLSKGLDECLGWYLENH